MSGRRRKTPLANAQKIDLDDTAATMGIVKAQVFKPPAGEKYSVPEVVDAKLNYLWSRYPNDDQLLFLKGVRVQDEDADEAISWCEKAIAINLNSLGSMSTWASFMMTKTTLI